MWVYLKDGTPVHVTLAKRGAKITERDIEAMREIAELLRPKPADYAQQYRDQCGG